MRPTPWKYAKLYYGIAFVIWVVYLLLSISSPQSAAAVYHLTTLELNAVKFSIALPYLGIWLVALYGAVRFKQYSEMVRESADGQALNTISNGLMILVGYVVTQNFLGVVVPYFYSSHWLRPLIFVQNHLPLLLALTAFIFIYLGATRLAATVGGLVMSFAKWTLIFLPYFVFTAVFGWLFYRYLQHPVINHGVPSFGLNGEIPLLSFVLPYLITWYLGIIATMHLVTYNRLVKGKIYRSALQALVRGIRTVLVVSVGLQLLAIDTKIFGKLTFWPLLGVVYLLLALYSLGFITIAMGASKLTRIEEVG